MRLITVEYGVPELFLLLLHHARPSLPFCSSEDETLIRIICRKLWEYGKHEPQTTVQHLMVSQTSFQPEAASRVLNSRRIESARYPPLVQSVLEYANSR